MQTEVIAWALEARQGSVRNTAPCNEMSTASVRYDALENEVQNANNQLMSSQSRYQTVLHEANSQTQRTAMLAEENNQLIEGLEDSLHFHQSRTNELAERYEHQLRDASIRVQQANLKANASILIGSPVPTLPSTIAQIEQEANLHRSEYQSRLQADRQSCPSFFHSKVRCRDCNQRQYETNTSTIFIPRT